MQLLLVLLLLFAWQLPAGAAAAEQTSSGHTSNWAVLVATSKYWYNYRHIANTLSFYRTVKRLGIPDSNIILMLAEDVSCNPRNTYPGQVFNDESHKLNVYGTNVEVDYRGYEVTVENFIRVLTGRHSPSVPRPKRLLSDRGSNVLVYISGHGGNEFMKFQDTQELMAQDVADAIAQMHEKGRYRELLLIVETCQAATLYSKINSPNVLSMASSLKGESSYSYLTDLDVGLSLIDRFTWSTLDFFEKVDIHSNKTLAQLIQIYDYKVLDSHFHYDASHYPRPLSEVPVTAFFGSVSRTQVTPRLQDTAGNLEAAVLSSSRKDDSRRDGSSQGSCSSSSSIARSAQSPPDSRSCAAGVDDLRMSSQPGSAVAAAGISTQPPQPLVLAGGGVGSSDLFVKAYVGLTALVSLVGLLAAALHNYKAS